MLNESVNRTGISILLVHHLRKMKADDPFEEISGTTGIAGAVDGMYVMKKLKDSRNEVSLTATGRDIQSFDLKIQFNEETHRWELLDKSLEDEVVDSEVSRAIELIDSVLEFNGSATELSGMLKMKFECEVTPATLSKKLKKNSQVLQKHDIEFKADRTSHQRSISLRKKNVICDVTDGSDGNNTL